MKYWRFFFEPEKGFLLLVNASPDIAVALAGVEATKMRLTRRGVGLVGQDCVVADGCSEVVAAAVTLMCPIALRDVVKRDTCFSNGALYFPPGDALE